jgi:hypothetical protein
MIELRPSLTCALAATGHWRGPMGAGTSLAAVVPATVRTLRVDKEEEMWQGRERSPVSLASS